MFIGHFALAFGAKKVAPMMSLGTLFAASQFADLLWPTLVLLGYERVDIQPGATRFTPLNFVSYPYSHSLVALAGWSALFAVAYRAIRGRHPVAIATIAALVFSHYVLDVITHRPDMPITLTGSQRLGFGLWNHPGTALAIESVMFIAGTTIYMSATRARDLIGRAGLYALIVVLVAVFFAALYGPPPPNPATVAIGGHLGWLFVLWAYWVDRHRAGVAAKIES